MVGYAITNPPYSGYKILVHPLIKISKAQLLKIITGILLLDQLKINSTIIFNYYDYFFYYI